MLYFIEKEPMALKLLIVRHGDPDYENDTLTEKGWREASCLAQRLAELEVRDFYVSPLGRARDTASLTLEKLGRSAVECPWLREFHAPIHRPDVTDRRMLCWDWLPQDWMDEARYFLPDQWFETEIMAEGGVKAEYDRVSDSLDALLDAHGYRRQGRLYEAVRPNNDVLVFFCHFGVECVLLSHLLNISPMPLWHGTCAAPTSVTTVVTEERRRGIASFRMGAFGDTSHLYKCGEPPSFSARFRECYDNDWERRD